MSDNNRILINAGVKACTEDENNLVRESSTGTKWYKVGGMFPHYVTESGTVELRHNDKAKVMLTRDAFDFIMMYFREIEEFYESEAYKNVLLVKARAKQEDKLKRDLAKKLVAGMSADEVIQKLGYKKA